MIFLTGGSGVLGKELKKHMTFYSPTRFWMDILNIGELVLESKVWENISLIIHCAAFTDLVRAESEKDLCYKTNVIGTRNIANLGIPMIYISTEYVFDGTKGNYSEEDAPNPLNYYSLTKLLGEYEALRNRAKTTVIRCLFKDRPFKHDQAPSDQFTSGDYVDVIARDIVRAVSIFDKLPEIIHIGGARKSTYELARGSRNVKEIKLEDIKTVKLPRDTSLNCSKWKELNND